MINHTPEWMDCDLVCPQCSANLFQHSMFPAPVRYETKCLRCNFSFQYFKRKDPYLELTQEEITLHFLEEKKKGIY